jgi:hypothetical protein
MNTIESNGGTPNGLIIAGDRDATFRNARQSASGLGDGEAGVHERVRARAGHPLRAPGALLLEPADPGPLRGPVIGVVGDFSHAILGIRKDITVRTTNTATINVSGTLHHLFQQNKVAALWEMRVGFVAHDLNRMFVAILNAA